MSVEDTITAVIARTKADALKHLDAEVDRCKADIAKWAADYLEGMKLLNDLSLLKDVLEHGGAVKQRTVTGLDVSNHWEYADYPRVRLGDSNRTDIEFPELRGAKAVRFIIIAEPVTPSHG